MRTPGNEVNYLLEKMFFGGLSPVENYNKSS